MPEARVTFDVNVDWVQPEFLEAALDDLVDMLGDVAKRSPAKRTEIYTWIFEHRGRRLTLEITARRVR